VVGAPTAGFGPGPSFTPELLLEDLDLVGEAEHELRVLHTPGHASDHLCYLLTERGLCFTGDHVMHGSTVVIRPPDGSVSAYLASLRRLNSLGSGLITLAPAHGRLIGEPLAAIGEIIAHREAREEVILEVLHAHGPGSASQLLGAVYPDLEEKRTEVATATLLAHLEHLVMQGKALRADSTKVLTNDTVFSPT
jgi:glyoxylase-like metal-dependent hydrolase (beta-lactamase superfamily II)